MTQSVVRFAAILLLGIGCEAHALTIAEQGQARCAIVVAPDAPPAVAHAADELARFLHEITGGDFSQRPKPGKQRSNLFVGPAAAKQADPGFTTKGLGPEGLVVRTIGDDLIIAGGEPRGTLYAVYTFLEEVLGCRWYTPNATVIPHVRTLKVPALGITQLPSFEYREPFYTPAFDADWAARNRCNGQHAKLDAKRGGKVTYGRWCHTFGELIPDKKYFKEHPEFFSLVDGKRISSSQHSGQICLTNPDVLKIATAKVLEWIVENPEAKIWGVSQNDNDLGYCRCVNCAAVAAEEGSQSGPILRFVNAVADEVAKKHPEILIDTLAYQYSLNPPQITKPRPNVRVRLCSISCCQLHPYEQCDHPRTREFMRALRGWRAVTENLYIWHYNTNVAHFLMPMPDLDELCADIPMYKRSGVKGLFMQGGGNDRYAGRFGAGFMDELKTYLIAKMLWNADRDPRKVIADFLDGYYGKAGKPIGKYLDLLHAKVRRENVHGMLCETPDWPYLSSDLLRQCDLLFDEAERAAEPGVVLARVKHARLSIEYVQVMRKVRGSLGLDPLPAQMTTPDYVRSMREGPAPDPSARDAAKAEALSSLEDFIKRCEADGMTHFGEVPYSVRSYFEAIAALLRKPSRAAAPPPKICRGLPKEDWVDVQDNEFLCTGLGDWVTIAKDPRASDGWAARMHGNHSNWAVQYHIPAALAAQGPWHCHLAARCDSSKTNGNAFMVALADRKAGNNVAAITETLDGAPRDEYRLYDLGVHRLTTDMFFWAAPPGGEGVDAVCIDRIVLVREPRPGRK